MSQSYTGTAAKRNMKRKNLNIYENYAWQRQVLKKIKLSFKPQSQISDYFFVFA